MLMLHSVFEGFLLVEDLCDIALLMPMPLVVEMEAMLLHEPSFSYRFDLGGLEVWRLCTGRIKASVLE